MLYSFVDFVLLLLGIMLLAIGGDIMIRGAIAAARRLRVSPLLAGLVIVGFGTSAPELFVTVDAVIGGYTDIAVGNVIGSNIGNVLLILGLSAVITPLTVKQAALRRDAVMVVAASALFLILARGEGLGRFDAAIFLMALFAYLGWAYWTERSHAAPSAELHSAEAETIGLLPGTVFRILASLLVGLLLLIAGAQALLAGAIAIASKLGVSEAFIGLTIVAVGTSLPELSISVIAAFRRRVDVAVGNILGSNIFNLLGILGISALLQPLAMHARVLQFDQWVMFATALVLLPFLYTRRILGRLEGGVLLLGYCVYIVVSLTRFNY